MGLGVGVGTVGVADAVGVTVGGMGVGVSSSSGSDVVGMAVGAGAPHAVRTRAKTPMRNINRRMIAHFRIQTGQQMDSPNEVDCLPPVGSATCTSILPSKTN